MRALGALLVLWGAGLFCLLRRREGLLPLRMGQAIAAELAILRYQICICRRPLPEICEELSGPLWTSLGRRLREAADRTLPDCWAEAVSELPPPLDGYLASLGPLLPAGGERLAAVFNFSAQPQDYQLKIPKAGELRLVMSSELGTETVKRPSGGTFALHLTPFSGVYYQIM